MIRRTATAVASGALLLLIGACGPGDTQAQAPSSTGSAATTAPVPSGPGSRTPEITVTNIAPYGEVLGNAKGFALYAFAPDNASKVTCTGTCAQTWPPLFATETTAKIAGKGLNPSLVSTDEDGSRSVVTYDHWPLYSYIGDAAPGYASGQDLDLNGGYWYLIEPNGTLIKQGP